MNRSNKAWAEGIATFALTFIGAGAICANQLTGGALGLTGIALAHGLTIVVMVYATFHISGAHINPAVTCAMFLAKRLDGKTAGAYVIAQLLGAVIAGWLLKCIYPQYVAAAPFLGNPEMTTALAGFGIGHAIVVEAITTFFLVFVIFAVAADDRGLKPAVGLAIGLTITLDILMAGPLTGAAMNPARAFGTAIATGRFANHIVYWIGPLLGGAVAGRVYQRWFLNK